MVPLLNVFSPLRRPDRQSHLRYCPSLRVKLISSKMQRSAKSSNARTLSFSSSIAARKPPIDFDVPSGYAPFVIRNSGNFLLLCTFCHGKSDAHLHRVLMSRGRNLPESIIRLVSMTCCPIGSSSIPSARSPKPLEANRAVPLPAKGSSSVPSDMRYCRSIRSTSPAENASLNLYQRYTARVLFA